MSQGGTQRDVHTKPPPRPEGISVRLYSNPICPYAQRARLALAAKGVEAEEIQIHLKRQPQWYIDEVNPTKQVPALEHNGNILRESLIVFDYVDEAFGGESLWNKDPYAKAKNRLLVSDYGNKFTPNYYKHYGNRQDESNTKEVVNFLAKLENILKEHKESGAEKLYLGGTEGKPLASDYLLWPWLERLEALSSVNEQLGAAIKKDQFPLFFEYVELMKQDPAVKKSLLPTENHVAFINKAVTGNHDYSVADLTGAGVTVYSRKED